MRQTLPISKPHNNGFDFCHLLKLQVHSQATLLGTPGRHGESSKKARRHGDMVTMLKPSIRIGKKGDLIDLSDFDCDIVVGADRLSGYFKNLLIYWNFPIQTSLHLQGIFQDKRKHPMKISSETVQGIFAQFSG